MTRRVSEVAEADWWPDAVEISFAVTNRGSEWPAVPSTAIESGRAGLRRYNAAVTAGPFSTASGTSGDRDVEDVEYAA